MDGSCTSVDNPCSYRIMRNHVILEAYEINYIIYRVTLNSAVNVKRPS